MLSFTATPTYPTTPFTPAIATADFNGDGRSDIVGTVFNSPQLTVSLAGPNNTFSAPTTLATPGTAVAAHPGDFNGDGKMDLEVDYLMPGTFTGADQGIVVFFGNGDGTFQPPVVSSLSGSMAIAKAADINGDGKADLILFPDSSGAVPAYLSNGDGTFSPATTFANGTNGVRVNFDDFNGDGIADQVVGNTIYNPTGTVTYTASISLGTGFGTFSPAATYTLFTTSLFYAPGTAPGFSLGTVDLNGDGRSDLVAVVDNDFTVSNASGGLGQPTVVHTMTQTNEGTLEVFPAGPGGVLQPASLTVDAGNSPSLQQVTDVNGDGRPDVLVATTDGTLVFINGGDGTFSKSFGNKGGLGLSGDFNGDGKLDFLSGDGTVLLGNGDGSFGTSSFVLAGNKTTDSATGDFNGDGNLDLVVANQNTVDVSLGLGHGEFLPKQTYTIAPLSTTIESGAVVVGDFTGDGKLDIAIAMENAPGEVAILVGNGDGTFQAPIFRGAAGHTTARNLHAADFNGDGIADLIVTNLLSESADIIAGGSLQPVASFPAGLSPLTVVGDFNGDGRPDFAVTHVSQFGGDTPATIYLNTGGFTFANSGSVIVGNGIIYSMTAADFNGDGHVDIATTSSGSSSGVTGPVNVLYGNGDGTFAPALVVAPGQTVIPNGFFPFDSHPGASIVAGDLNGDGIEDLAVTGTNDVGVLYGRGDGGFYPATFYPSTTGIAGDLTLGDFNNDGHPDIVEIDNGPTTGFALRGAADVMLFTPDDRTAQSTAVGFQISAPPVVTENLPFSVTVTAVDAAGNPVPNFTGTVYLSSDNQLATAYTFTAADAGAHSFSNAENLLTAGTHVISAGNPDLGASHTSVLAKPGHFQVTVAPTAVAGTDFAITASAFDAFGNPMPSYSGAVLITTTDPKAPNWGQFINPSNNGVLTSTINLDTAGTQTLSFTAPFMDVTVGTPVVITPAAPTFFRISDPGAVTAGVPFNFTVTNFDKFGNFAPGYTPTISFTDTLDNRIFFSTDPGAVLPGAYTFTAADAGVHQFTATLTVAGLTSIGAFNTGGGARQLLVLAAPVSQLRLTTSFPSIPAGTTFALTYQALDRFGNLAGGFTDTLRLASSDAQAVLSPDVTAQNTGGPLVTLKTAGLQTISLMDLNNPTLTVTTAPFSLLPGAVSSFTMTALPTETAGLAQSFTVAAHDMYGNVATNYTGTVQFSSSDTRATLPLSYTFTAADAGVHTFSDTLITAGTDQLVVQDSVTGALGSASVSVKAAAAASFTVSGFPATTAGVAQQFTVTARDAFGNLAAGYTGTVQFSSSDVQAGLPAQYTFSLADNGSHTFTATLKTAGTQSLSVTDSSSATVSGTQTGISVTHSTATHLGITAPATAGTGKSFVITVSALDAFGNVDTGYLGKIHLGATVSTSLSSNYSFTAGDAGVHSFNVTLNVAGAQTISATDTINSLIFASAPITVSTPTSGGGGGGGATGGGGGGGGGGGTSGKTA